MERDRRGHRQFSPNQWIWFWRIGMVVIGPLCVLAGVFGEPFDPRIIFLGIVFEVVGFFMIGYWRQVQANRDERAEQAGQPTSEAN